jgi:hypothetical protein
MAKVTKIMDYDENMELIEEWIVDNSCVSFIITKECITEIS